MFIDELTINIKAGKGGNGIVSWRHEKGLDHAGPGGGDGGRGGDVYLKGVSDISKLSEYRFVKDFKAKDGENGLGDCMRGKSGEDLILELPIGSVVINKNNNTFVEVLDMEKFLFLKGGSGGYGNNHFKGPNNVRPKEFTLGKVGEGGEFFIELKLIVDLGLIGFPNVGKSSLLNTLTKAQAKVGNYNFTTLHPNLGNMYGFILADIPGLIEGASGGKGLGYKFLRHISRTKALLHCISASDENPEESYSIIRKELEQYNPDLLKKEEIILFTKSDLVDSERLNSLVNEFQNKNKNVFTVSVIDDLSVKSLNDELVKILRKI